MIRARTKRRVARRLARWSVADMIGALLIGGSLVGMAYHGPTFVENTLCNVWPDGHCYAREDARRP